MSTTPLSRRGRTTAAVITVGAIALSLVGCATQAEPATPVDQSELTARIGALALPPGKGEPWGANGGWVWPAIFDTLTKLDTTGNVLPAAAESWESTSDTTWEFTLREDVAFSNGEPFDAEAVVATIEYLVDDERGQTLTPRVQSIPGVSGATVVDEYTVEIETSTPQATLPGQLSGVYVVAPDYFAEVGYEEFANAPIGSGPYTVEAWDAGTVTLTANPESWRAPIVGTVEVIELPDPDARVKAVQSGQVNIAAQLSPEHVSQLESAGATAIVNLGTGVGGYAFVAERADSPVANQLVRQALNYAVDKEAIAEALYYGLTEPSGQTATPSTFGYNPEIDPYPYDPEKAKELLAEAGYPDGFATTVQFVEAMPVVGQEIQAVAADLAKVGVELTIEPITVPQWLEGFQTVNWSGDLFAFVVENTSALDAAKPYGSFSSLNPNPFFTDPEVDRLLAEAAAEFDPEARRLILQELLQRSHDNPASIFTVITVNVVGTSGVEQVTVVNNAIEYETIVLASNG